MGKRMINNPHIGSSLDDLLEADGVLKEIEAIAKKRQRIFRLKDLQTLNR